MPTRLPDPFAIQTDPRLYVPRRATEEALDALERAVSLPHAVVSFTGPPGLGKTLLLRVLAAELAPRFRTAYLPYARLPSGGVWTWAARELALEPEDDAKEALRRIAGELQGEGRALLLEVDDASSLPADTLAELTAFARDEPGLRLVLAFSEDERLAEPPPEGAAVVRLEQPMTRAETQDYVKGRLVRSAAPRDVAQRFDTATVARLHRESEGNPLRVHALADDVVRAPAQVAAAVREPLAAPRAKNEPIAAPRAGGEPLAELRAKSSSIAESRADREPVAEPGGSEPSAESRADREPVAESRGSEPIAEPHGREPIVESHGSARIAALRAKDEPAAEPRAESVTAPPSPVQRAETTPAALEPEAAAALSQRAKRAAPAKRPGAHRSRAGASRDSRRLGRLLAGAAGLCVGLVAGVGAERWVTGRFAPPSATKPAPAVSSPPFVSSPAPAPSPSGAIAAPPQTAPTAPAPAPPSGAQSPQTAAPPTAAESPPPAASSPQLAAPPTPAASPQGAATQATPPPTPATVPPAATAPATADAPPQGAAAPQPAVPRAAPDLPQAPAPQQGAAPPPTGAPSSATPQPTAAPPQAAAPPSAPASPASPGASMPPAAVAPPPVAATPPSAPAPPAPSAATTGSVAAPPPAAASAPVPQPSPGAAVPPGRSEPAVPESRRAAPIPPPPPVEAPWALGRLAVEADAPVLVEIDGQPFGATPLSDVRLRRGLHRVVAHYRDGGVGQKTIYLGDEDVLVTFR